MYTLKRSNTTQSFQSSQNPSNIRKPSTSTASLSSVQSQGNPSSIVLDSQSILGPPSLNSQPRSFRGSSLIPSSALFTSMPSFSKRRRNSAPGMFLKLEPFEKARQKSNVVIITSDDVPFRSIEATANSSLADNTLEVPKLRAGAGKAMSTTSLTDPLAKTKSGNPSLSSPSNNTSRSTSETISAGNNGSTDLLAGSISTSVTSMPIISPNEDIGQKGKDVTTQILTPKLQRQLETIKQTLLQPPQYSSALSSPTRSESDYKSAVSRPSSRTRHRRHPSSGNISFDIVDMYQYQNSSMSGSVISSPADPDFGLDSHFEMLRISPKTMHDTRLEDCGMSHDAEHKELDPKRTHHLSSVKIEVKDLSNDEPESIDKLLSTYSKTQTTAITRPFSVLGQQHASSTSPGCYTPTSQPADFQHTALSLPTSGAGRRDSAQSSLETYTYNAAQGTITKQGINLESLPDNLPYAHRSQLRNSNTAAADKQENRLLQRSASSLKPQSSSDTRQFSPAPQQLERNVPDVTGAFYVSHSSLSTHRNHHQPALGRSIKHSKSQPQFSSSARATGVMQTPEFDASLLDKEFHLLRVADSDRSQYPHSRFLSNVNSDESSSSSFPHDTMTPSSRSKRYSDSFSDRLNSFSPAVSRKSMRASYPLRPPSVASSASPAPSSATRRSGGITPLPLYSKTHQKFLQSRRDRDRLNSPPMPQQPAALQPIQHLDDIPHLPPQQQEELYSDEDIDILVNSSVENSLTENEYPHSGNQANISMNSANSALDTSADYSMLSQPFSLGTPTPVGRTMSLTSSNIMSAPAAGLPRTTSLRVGLSSGVSTPTTSQSRKNRYSLGLDFPVSLSNPISNSTSQNNISLSNTQFGHDSSFHNFPRSVSVAGHKPTINLNNMDSAHNSQGPAAAANRRRSGSLWEDLESVKEKLRKVKLSQGIETPAKNNEPSNLDNFSDSQFSRKTTFNSTEASYTQNDHNISQIQRTPKVSLSSVKSPVLSEAALSSYSTPTFEMFRHGAKNASPRQQTSAERHLSEVLECAKRSRVVTTNPILPTSISGSVRADHEQSNFSSSTINDTSANISEGIAESTPSHATQTANTATKTVSANTMDTLGSTISTVHSDSFDTTPSNSNGNPNTNDAFLTYMLERSASDLLRVYNTLTGDDVVQLEALDKSALSLAGFMLQFLDTYGLNGGTSSTNQGSSPYGFANNGFSNGPPLASTTTALSDPLMTQSNHHANGPQAHFGQPSYSAYANISPRFGSLASLGITHNNNASASSISSSSSSANSKEGNPLAYNPGPAQVQQQPFRTHRPRGHDHHKQPSQIHSANPGLFEYDHIDSKVANSSTVLSNNHMQNYQAHNQHYYHPISPQQQSSSLSSASFHQSSSSTNSGNNAPIQSRFAGFHGGAGGPPVRRLSATPNKAKRHSMSFM